MKKHTLPNLNCQSSEFLPVSTSHLEYTVTVPAAQADGGVPLENRGGLTRITYPPQVANFGIDTLWVCFHVAFDHPEKIFPALAEQKKWLQSGSDNECHFKFGETDLFSWNLQRSGSRQYPYMAKTGDITLKLTSQLHTGVKPNVCLEIGSISCQEGLEDTVRRFKMWIHQIGGTIFQEYLSRLDPCVDIKIPIGETGMEDYLRHICRSRHYDLHVDDRKMTGVTIGRGQVLLRAYDKMTEMETKQAYEKQSFFKHLWGGKQECMTRVEYQLRREAIKEMFPRDSRVETIIKLLPRIWKYLTEKWFRLADCEVDRENKHQSRCEVSNFWKIVQGAAGFARSAITRKKKQRHINIPGLKTMVRGCMVTIAAGMGHCVDDFFGIMSTCRDILENEVATYMETVDFKQKFAIKQTAAYVTF